MKNIIIVLLLIVCNINADEQFNDPKEILMSSVKNTNELIKNVDPSLWNVTKRWEEYYKAESGKQAEKHPTFFFFFTLGENSDISTTSLKYFTAASSKLKIKHTDMRFYGVLNGFPNNQDKMRAVFMDEVKRGDATAGGVKIRFFPSLYEDLSIDEVPAYAYAECSESFGSDKGCDFKFLVRGAVGMEGLLDLMAEKDTKYKGWAHDLNEAQ